LSLDLDLLNDGDAHAQPLVSRMSALYTAGDFGMARGSLREVDVETASGTPPRGVQRRACVRRRFRVFWGQAHAWGERGMSSGMFARGFVAAAALLLAGTAAQAQQ
jgi:hypothetical protein